MCTCAEDRLNVGLLAGFGRKKATTGPDKLFKQFVGFCVNGISSVLISDLLLMVVVVVVSLHFEEQVVVENLNFARKVIAIINGQVSWEGCLWAGLVDSTLLSIYSLDYSWIFRN